MILEAIEVVERRAPRRVGAVRASPVGVAVPRQSHGAPGETGGSGRAMERAPRGEAPVLIVHEPSEGVGGTRRPREALGARALRAFAAEVADHLPERACWQARRGPRAQPAQPLGALCPGAGVLDRPDPVEDERTPGAITPTACGDREDRVEATQEKASRRAEAPPGALRAFPALGAHRRGAGGGRQRVRLLGTRAVSGRPRVGRGRLGHGRAEEAAASPRGRNIHRLSQSPGGLLVSEHVRGEFRGRLDGAADDCRPSQGQRRPLPVHRVAPEHGNQGVAGHTPVTQREGLCHGRRPPHHGGPQERRPDQAHRGWRFARLALCAQGACACPVA